MSSTPRLGVNELTDQARSEPWNGRDALMRGRKPLPSNVVRLRGNPGKRRLNDAEPQPGSPGAGLPLVPRRRGAQGVEAPVQGAGGARPAHGHRPRPARRLLPGARPLGRGGRPRSALRHHGQVTQRLPDAEPLCRGRQQAGRDHGADRRRVRHDALLAHPHPGRRQGSRGPVRGVPGQRHG